MDAVFDLMDKLGTEHDMALDISEEIEEYNIRYTFYDYDTFYTFITGKYNCFDVYVYATLKEWFTTGNCYNSSYLQGWMKNTDTFISLRCLNPCIYCKYDKQRVYELDLEQNFPFVRVNPLTYKIIVEYENLSEEEWLVWIKIPIICKRCIEQGNKHRYHSEFHQYLRFNQCKALQSIERYPLCEPKLKPYIFKFLPTINFN